MRYILMFFMLSSFILIISYSGDGYAQPIEKIQSVTPTPDPLHEALELAQAGVENNDDWTPIEQDFTLPQGGVVTMVLVPAGCFDMGENGEGGTQCFDESLWIGKYEVTNAEYAEFIAAGGYDNPDYWTEEGWTERQSAGWTQPAYWTDSTWNGDDQPVVGVSWYEAMAYANWRGMRLPTEAEWEYAARGVDGLLYPWGDEWNPDNLNWADTSPNVTFAVGSFPSGVSWVGAHDLSGNVWEWTLSEYADYPYVADDGRENVSSNARRVLRGGSWDDDDYFARAACRYNNGAHPRLNFIGFRIVRPPSVQP